MISRWKENGFFLVTRAELCFLATGGIEEKLRDNLTVDLKVTVADELEESFFSLLGVFNADGGIDLLGVAMDFSEGLDCLNDCIAT